MIKNLSLRILDKLGYKILKSRKENPDFEPEFTVIQKTAGNFSMTSPERMYALYKAVEYVSVNAIKGDYVECGVWKGGSSMLAASAFKSRNDTGRKLFLYDTFEGMSEPSDADISFSGNKVKDNWTEVKRDEKIFCYSALDEVKINMHKTGYPENNIVYVKGKVEETIPATMPSSISLLRLDTDWYESTYHELKYLYPLVHDKGIIILDDYGHWQGAKKAVDQYFEEIGIRPYLHRIDYTGRLFIKSAE